MLGVGFGPMPHTEPDGYGYSKAELNRPLTLKNSDRKPPRPSDLLCSCALLAQSSGSVLDVPLCYKCP